MWAAARNGYGGTRISHRAVAELVHGRKQVHPKRPTSLIPPTIARTEWAANSRRHDPTLGRCCGYTAIQGRNISTLRLRGLHSHGQLQSPEPDAPKQKDQTFSSQCIISICCLTVPALLTALQRSSLRRCPPPQAAGLEATTQPRTLPYTAAHQEQSSLEFCDQERSCGPCTHHSSSSHNERTSVP